MAIVEALARHRNLLYESFSIIVRNYATPGFLSLGKKMKKTDFKITSQTDVPLEKDAEKLVAFVCGTKLFKESGENVAIKPDSEYPDWLFTLHTGEPLPLSQLDPNTMEYWERVRELGIQQELEINSLYRQKRDHK